MQYLADNSDMLKQLAKEHGTPLFVYDRAVLTAQADRLKAVPAPFGYQPRYAMKANPHPDIVRFFTERSISIDASSSYEAEAAVSCGIAPGQIMLTSQQSAHNLKELVKKGVQYNATSLQQLRLFGEQFPGSTVGVRLNPGIGSGQSRKTNVGGVTSSFGIWHEQLDTIFEIAEQYSLTINRLHTHIGSGTDPLVWKDAIEISLALAKQFPDITTVNLGGGFKVARTVAEQETPIEEVGDILRSQLETFYRETGKKLQLELELGNFLVANAGVLLASVDDIVSTGSQGYRFIKLNTGMNDILRPTLYAAQHPISVLNDKTEQEECVVVGHNCESGDLLTPAPTDPEELMPRLLNKASIGDIVAIGGAGAYCSSMSAHGYNQFPSAKEVVV